MGLYWDWTLKWPPSSAHLATVGRGARACSAASGTAPPTMYHNIGTNTEGAL